ncbi:hypothetical protein ACH4M4_23985 [Streptomyces sp. NPDC017254]|uniref:hypothetical protein n=1 Tax=unclassified Streptomyces TaxID=2593676 RepID=UPI0037973823
MTSRPPDEEPPATPREAREETQPAGEELGETAEAPVTKADMRIRARGQAAAVKEQAIGKATHVTGQIRDRAGQAKQLLKEKTPDPVLDKATHTATQVHDAASRAGQFAAERAPEPVRERTGRLVATARANRTPLILAAALVVLLLVGRGRRAR